MAVDQLNSVGLPSSGVRGYSQEFFVADTNYGGFWTFTSNNNNVGGSIQNVFKGICYGNGKFVAVGSISTPAPVIAFSTDGATWSTATTGLSGTSTLYAVTYAAGVFVAVGASVCYTSTDGVAWTSRTIPAGNYHYITYFNSLFITAAGGAASTTLAVTSPDGINWTSRTLPSSQRWAGLANNGTTCVVVAGGTKDGTGVQTTAAAYTTDGVTWTAATMPQSRYWSGVAYGNGFFVAVNQDNNGSSNYLSNATSPDGITWTGGALGSLPDVKPKSGLSAYPNIVFVNGKFFLCSFSTRFGAYSSDGSTSWTAYPLVPYPNVGAEFNTYDMADNGSGLGVAACARGYLPSTSATAQQTWTCPLDVTQVQVFAVGGGGAGGHIPSSVGSGGGGGGGAVVTRVLQVTPGATYNINIGAGGQAVRAGSGGNGGATQFIHADSGLVLVQALGGGGGGVAGSAGSNGGCGGGGGSGLASQQGAGGGGGALGPGQSWVPGSSTATGVNRGGLGTQGGGGGNGQSNATGSNIGGDGGLAVNGYGGGGGGSGSSQMGSMSGANAGRGGSNGGPNYNALPFWGGGGGGSNAQSWPGGYGGCGYLRLDWWA